MSKKLFRAIAFSIILGGAIWLYLTGTLENAILLLNNYGYAGAFLSGLFLTSGFTTPFAIAVFLSFRATLNLFAVAFLGAFGATLMDYFLFSSTKKIVRQTRVTASAHVFKFKKFPSFVTAIIGGVVLASPLPDEIAVSLVGVAQLDAKTFVVLAFFFKFLGILAIVLVGQVI